MHNLIKPISQLQASDWKFFLKDSSYIPDLQSKIDEAEKMLLVPFIDFTDPEMLYWFLYRKEHLNSDNDKSKRTIDEYKRELIQFIEHLMEFSSDIDLDIDTVIEGSLFKSLSRRHVRRYQQWLAESSPYVKAKGSYSAATLARKTVILKSFLSFLYDSGYIKDPIHKGFLTATVRKDDRPNRDLGPREVIMLLDYFRQQNHPVVFAIIHLLTTTGLRNEEFCKLTVGDLQYDSLSNGYYLNVLGKGNKRRQIPLREKSLDSILMFRKARGLEELVAAKKTSPLFTTNTGKPYTPSYLSQYLTKMIKRTDLPFLSFRSSQVGPHTFRHSFAIISHISNIDIYKIMKSLGHEKIETTMIYLEKVLEKEQHAIHGWKEEVLGNYI